MQVMNTTAITRERTDIGIYEECPVCGYPDDEGHTDCIAGRDYSEDQNIEFLIALASIGQG